MSARALESSPRAAHPTILAVLVCMLLLPVPVVSQEAEGGPTYSRRTLLEFLQKLCSTERLPLVEAAQKRMVPHIVRRGVNFRMTSRDETQLREACATEQLIAAVRENNRCPAQEIPLSGSAEAELSAECPTQEYRIDVPCGGALTAEAEALTGMASLELSDPAGNRIAEGPRIVREVKPGGYYLSVRAAVEGAEGRFRLRTSFTCPIRKIGEQAETVDRISEGDCRISHCGMAAIPATPINLASACAHQYRLQIVERGTLMVDLVSTDFDPYLFLLDSNGRITAEDDNGGGGVNARLLTSPLRPGSYTLLAAAPRAGAGQYRLRTVFKSRPCTVRTIRLGESAEQAISAEDCRRSELSPSSSDSTSLVHEYRFQVERSGPVTIELVSQAFAGRLALVDSSGKQIAEDDNSGGGRNPRIQRNLPPGNYRALAMARGGGAGAYTFRTTQGCVVKEIPLNAVVAETLSEADCEASNKSLLDVYRLTTIADTRLSVEIDAAGFAPYLILLQADGKQIAGGPGKRLERALPPGSFAIVATSVTRSTGAYELRVSSRAPPCMLGEILPGGNAKGRLSSGDCRLREVTPASQGQQHAHRYRVRIPYRGELTVSLGSPDFDPQLMLFDATYGQAREKNVWRWADNLRMIWSVEPGTYLVVATSRGVSAGDYTLQTSFVPQQQ